MANVLANLAREYCSTVGTGSLVLTGAVNSGVIGIFNSFANAGITNGQVVTYAIEDTSGREVGQGTYTSATKTLTRDTVYSSTNGGSKLDLSGGAQVFVTGSAADLDGPQSVLAYGTPAASDTTSFQALWNSTKFAYVPPGSYSLGATLTYASQTPVFIAPNASFSDWSKVTLTYGFIADDNNDTLGGADKGVNIWRLNDRVFIGAGSNSWGGSSAAGGHVSYLSSDFGAGYLERAATLYSASPNGGVGGTFTSRHSDQYGWYGVTVWAQGQSVTTGDYRGYADSIYQAASTGTTGATGPTHDTGTVSDGSVSWTFVQHTLMTCIGLAAFAKSDVKDGTGAWAGYIEGVRGSGCSSIRGFEIAVKNLGDLKIVTPYSTTVDGETSAIHFNGGGDASYGGTPANPASAAMVLAGQTAGKVFEKGLIFRDGSINGTDVAAIALARTHKVAQYNSTGLGSYLSGDVSDTTKTVGLEMSDDLFATKIRGTQRLGVTNTGVDITGTGSVSGVLTASSTVELGHASDTTLSRLSAGIAAVEGSQIATVNGGGANIAWTTTHSITTAAASTVPMQYICTDAGAGQGPYFYLYRNSASPAAADGLAALSLRGNDSNGNITAYAEILLTLDSATDGAEDATFAIAKPSAGSVASRFKYAKGLVIGFPTGSDKGNATINAGALYDDSVLLTCPVGEFLQSGSVNTATWDALVPDIEEPEFKYTKDETEEIEIVEPDLVEDTDGTFKTVVLKKKRRVPKVELVPVYAEDGLTGIDMKEVQVKKNLVTPAKTVKRQHHAAHEFKALLDSGYDPNNADHFFDAFKRDGALPGLPNRKNWEHGSLSLGQMTNKQTLAIELVAMALNATREELKSVKSELKALKAKVK